MMRRAPFDQSRDVRGQSVRICPNKEMHMIRLNSQLNNLPIMLTGRFMDDLLKPTSNGTIEYLSPSPWTPDNVVHNQVGCVVIMNVFHVYRIVYVDMYVKGKPKSTPQPLPHKR